MKKKLFVPLIIIVFLIIAGGVFWLWQIEKEYSEMKKFIEEQTKGALTPKDIGLEIPETNFENITTLPTGEKVSSEIISISVREGVDEETVKKIVESIEGTIVGKIPEIGGYYIKFKSPKTGDEIKNIIDELRRNPNIETASPERFYEPKEGILPVTDIESNKLSEKNKWGFENIGILDAWKIIRDNKKVLSDVVVAVIDTGVGLSHSDLKENIMLNVNGYSAWDFGDDDTDVNPDKFYPSIKLEYFFLGPSHGTAVAGIIASVVNGQEINGVAPLAKIFPLKCFPSVPKEIEKRLLEKVSGVPIPEYSLTNAVFWATKAKVDIINLSLGAYYSSLEEFQQTLLYKILNNLTLKENIIVVSAAGNENKDASNFFPSAMEGVIAVGATNNRNQRASFSNFSLSDNRDVLEISAPGEIIYTTFTEKRKILRGYSHTYDYFYGTSASTPFVSGVAALLKQLNKDISSDQIRETIFSTADIIQVNFPNDSKTHLWRKVNAEKAVREILGIQKLTEKQEPEILKIKEEEALDESEAEEIVEEKTYKTTTKGKIAFTSYRDGNWEIYIMNVDGSEQTRLTNVPTIDWYPSFSPDGSKIVFESDRGENRNPEIYIMNVDGSEQVNLTNNPAVDEWPCFSPDGSKIAFYSNRDGKHENYIMNVDGSEQTRLTDNPEWYRNNSFSPDGSKIVFVSDRDGNWEIYIMNADGSGQRRLTNDPADDSDPCFSPDGSKIAFESDRDGNREIYIMNVDGSEQTNLTNNPTFDWGPSFSP